MSKVKPLIQLEENGASPELKYSIPEPTSYYGSQLIDLSVPFEMFKTKYSDPKNYPEDNVSDKELEEEVKEYNRTGIVPRAVIGGSASRGNDAGHSSRPELEPKEVLSKRKEDLVPVFVRSMSGKILTKYISKRKKPEPRLFLVEKYKLSTHLGDYGAGKVIKTMTLLPGERTKIHIKTYKKTESTSKSASSILDSYTEESAQEFESSVLQEESNTEKKDKSFEYYADADVNQSWGTGNANISAGVSGSTNSSREEFSKNVSNATDKHSMKASSKRDVSIETSYEVKEETGEERSIERTIENINVARTLNFIFRQMNQKFYSFLSLVDVKIGFYNGYERKEVAIGEMDSLLHEFCISESVAEELKDKILVEMQSISDDRGDIKSLVEEVKGIKDVNNKPMVSYWRVKNDIKSEYIDTITGYEQVIDGILLKSTTNVMRTDGVIVESLLGTSESLDSYNHKLQGEAVQSSVLENKKLELALKIVESIEDPVKKVEAFERMLVDQPLKNEN